MTDTHAKPRSNTIFTLSHNWKAELDESLDTSIAFTDVTETGSECEENSNLTFDVSATSRNGIRSPWRYEETRGSSSSSSLASSADLRPKTPKSSNKTRSSPIESLSCKKTFHSKNSLFKTPSSRKKCWNTSRSKWAVTTGKKNNSKYSWKGTFTDQRVRRAIFSTGNTSACFDIDNEKSPFVSTTRSSSPVDEKLFYSVDSDTEAQVFRFAKSRSPGPSCCQDRYENPCDDQDPRRCGEHSIEDPDVGECNNVQSRERIYSHDSEHEFHERKTDQASDYSYGNNDLMILGQQVDLDERRRSRFGLNLIRTSRASVTSDSSTMDASGGSGRSKSSRKSNLSRTSLKDTVLTANIVDDEDGQFEIEKENLEVESNQNFNVYTTTADLWVTGEWVESSSGNCQVSTSKFRSVLCCLGNFVIIILKNVVLLSILPTVYIAVFICVQNREDRDSF